MIDSCAVRWAGRERKRAKRWKMWDKYESPFYLRSCLIFVRPNHVFCFSSFFNFLFHFRRYSSLLFFLKHNMALDWFRGSVLSSSSPSFLFFAYRPHRRYFCETEQDAAQIRIGWRSWYTSQLYLSILIPFLCHPSHFHLIAVLFPIVTNIVYRSLILPSTIPSETNQTVTWGASNTAWINFLKTLKNMRTLNNSSGTKSYYFVPLP